jgi:hypothetical protein
VAIQKPASDYAAGWLLTSEPKENLILISGHAWSEVFIGVETKRIFKIVKKNKEWYRFAWISAESPSATVA